MSFVNSAFIPVKVIQSYFWSFPAVVAFCLSFCVCCSQHIWLRLDWYKIAYIVMYIHLCTWVICCYFAAYQGFGSQSSARCFLHAPGTFWLRWPATSSSVYVFTLLRFSASVKIFNSRTQKNTVKNRDGWSILWSLFILCDRFVLKKCCKWNGVSCLFIQTIHFCNSNF